MTGIWTEETYKNNLIFRKDDYLNKVYNTEYDLPIPNLEDLLSDPNYDTARYAKFHLFLYCLDYEIRELTGQAKTLSDVLVYWRNNLERDFTNAELLGALNACTQKDFTEFFNKYYFGIEKLPVEKEWLPWTKRTQTNSMPWIPLLLLN
jgi:predicted metalloprotease with PDZ domain